MGESRISEDFSLMWKALRNGPEFSPKHCHQCFCSQFFFCSYLDTLIQKIYIMKINIFRGELTDILAKKKHWLPRPAHGLIARTAHGVAPPCISSVVTVPKHGSCRGRCPIYGVPILGRVTAIARCIDSTNELSSSSVLMKKSVVVWTWSPMCNQCFYSQYEITFFFRILWSRKEFFRWWKLMIFRVTESFGFWKPLCVKLPKFAIRDALGRVHP